MTPKMLVHVMPWFGNGKIHRMDRYISNNQYTIAKQLDCMQKFKINGMPISGVIMTWEGPLVTFEHSTAIAMSVECGERGMLFALLIDQWAAKVGKNGTNYTANVIDALNDSTTQTILNAPSYLPEKYVLNFASTNADLGILGTAFPTLKFLQQGQGYGWINITSTVNSGARNAAAVANLAVQNANPAMKIPALCGGFNDSGMPTPAGVNLASWTGSRDLTTSVWGGNPSRVLDGQGGNFFFDQVLALPSNVSYIGYTTWNDYDEGTDIEAKASISTGIAIR